MSIVKYSTKTSGNRWLRARTVNEGTQADYPKRVDLKFNLSEEMSKLESTRELIKIIANINTLLYAYEKIKSKPGNLTPGVDKKITLDGIS